MKPSLPCLLLSILGTLLFLSGATASGESPPLPWSVVYFPRNDTYRAWEDLRGEIDYAPRVEPRKIPETVAAWEFAVCSVDDSKKTARIPVPNPHVGDTLDWSVWTPYEFKIKSEKIDPLNALGEGTFLCAVLADGKRCTNVFRIRILKSYDIRSEPMIRVQAIPLIGGGSQVECVGAWVIAQSSTDKRLLTPVLDKGMEWEINGTWSTFKFSGLHTGQLSQLQPGDPYSKVYVLEGNYEPPIEPFSYARVRLRYSEKLANSHLIDKGKDDTDLTLNPYRDYTSGFFDLKIDRTDELIFDRHFIAKNPL